MVKGLDLSAFTNAVLFLEFNQIKSGKDWHYYHCLKPLELFALFSPRMRTG